MLSSHPATPNTFSALAKTAVSGLTQAATKPSTQSFCILQTGTPPVLLFPSLSTAKSSLRRIKTPAQHMCELKQASCYCSASEECPQCRRRKSTSQHLHSSHFQRESKACTKPKLHQVVPTVSTSLRRQSINTFHTCNQAFAFPILHPKTKIHFNIPLQSSTASVQHTETNTVFCIALLLS